MAMKEADESAVDAPKRIEEPRCKPRCGIEAQAVEGAGLGFADDANPGVKAIVASYKSKLIALSTFSEALRSADSPKLETPGDEGAEGDDDDGYGLRPFITNAEQNEIYSETACVETQYKVALFHAETRSSHEQRQGTERADAGSKCSGEGNEGAPRKLSKRQKVRLRQKTRVQLEHVEFEELTFTEADLPKSEEDELDMFDGWIEDAVQDGIAVEFEPLVRHLMRFQFASWLLRRAETLARFLEHVEQWHDE